MLIFALLLAASLFFLFYSLFVGDFDKLQGIKEWLKRFLIPVITACACFLLGSLICRTPLAGIPWAILGWLAPGWIADYVTEKRKSAHRDTARSFVAAASGLYAAGQVTPEVVKTVSTRFPEPFASEFQNMLAKRNLDSRASFPVMFEGLTAKYGIPDFKAVAAIVNAAERAGGPQAVARGLKRLAQANRSMDRLARERRKAMLEPLIAALVVIGMLAFGFLLDVTSFSKYFFGSGGVAGRIVISLASTLIVGITVIITKAVSPKDLA